MHLITSETRVEKT